MYLHNISSFGVAVRNVRKKPCLTFVILGNYDNFMLIQRKTKIFSNIQNFTPNVIELDFDSICHGINVCCSCTLLSVYTKTAVDHIKTPRVLKALISVFQSDCV